jgi:hypothetical protein
MGATFVRRTKALYFGPVGLEDGVPYGWWVKLCSFVTVEIVPRR